MNIEPDTHIEIRQTRNEISVLYEAEYTIAILDEVARKFNGVLDDTLLTRLGYVRRETCRIVKTWSDSDYDEDWRYRCSECGCFIPVNERDPETGDVIDAANFCPNCGRRVID